MNDMALKAGLKAASAEAEKSFKNPGVYIEALYRAAAAYRGANYRRQSWKRAALVGTRLFHATAAPEADRRDARGFAPLGRAGGYLPGGGAFGEGGPYTNAGTVEFIVDSDNRFISSR